MSRTSLLTAAATGAFVAAGILSGMLIDERGGALGAVAWVLRTVTVVAAAVVVVGGSVLVLRVRRRARRRALGWTAATAAWVAFAWFVAIPVGYGVYLTHLPARDAVAAGGLGARAQPVTVPGPGGLRLRGSYVPSRNGAAVVALHGTGGSRMGVARQTRLLARHGYGVLALDLPGHGESDGRSTSLPWLMADDIEAAVRWLGTRPGVDASRVAALGISLGGEAALQVAARNDGLRAVVAEGVMGTGAEDLEAGGAGPLASAQVRVMNAVGGVLGGSAPPASDGELVRRIAPRPLLLISGGQGQEARANRVFAAGGGPAAEHWNVANAPHGGALATDPAGYERRVVGFLDGALLG